MQRDSPWKFARNFVQGYEGVQTYRWFEDKNLQNLILMLNENVQLRKSFLSKLDGLIQNKNESNKIKMCNWFVEDADAQRYTTKEFQKRNLSGAEETVSNVFLISLSLREEIKHMIKFGALIPSPQPFYHCKQCSQYGIGNRCIYFGSHKPKLIKTYILPEFSYRFWSNSPDKFLEGMCYVPLKNLRGANVEPCWSYRKRGASEIHGEIDVIIKLNSNMKVNLPSNFSDFDDSQIAILATTSVTSEERKQVDKLFDLKVPCIFITTEKIKFPQNRCMETFIEVDDDKNFPKNLVNYIDKLTITRN
jgi:hypothetical protein